MATDLDATRQRVAAFMECLAAAKGSLVSASEQAERDREAFVRGDLTIEQFERHTEDRLRGEMRREKRGEGVA